MVNLAGTSNLDWALQTFFKEEEAQSLFAKVEQMANSRPAGAGGLGRVGLMEVPQGGELLRALGPVG
jgi:hypothetical protein